MIFSLDNLTKTTVQADLNPWDFRTDKIISQQIRHDKLSRQAWYGDVGTQHNYYSFFEGINPRLRVTKESNPPVFIHGFAADFDTVIHDETVARHVAEMRLKPAYIETSLGGHRRLVWLLEQPIACGDYDFAVFLMERAEKWLELHRLPLLDKPCWVAPERLLCNGLVWEKVGEGLPVKKSLAQAFFVECGRAYNYKAKDCTTIPLSIIEKQLRATFPRMADWPESFEYESAGPSFWISDSVSPKSAIVKKEGMFTFAGHAVKPFYSWTDLLGSAFVREFTDEQMGTATSGIYFDGKSYWAPSTSMKCIVPVDKDSLIGDLKVNQLISTKPDKDGCSQMDKILSHVRQHNRVRGAAPVLFRPAGVLDISGSRVLNTLTESKVLPPAAEPAVWGPAGNLPFLSMVFDNAFEPHDQLRHFFSVLKHRYVNALAGTPRSGQACFLAGGPSMGKTLISTKIIAGLFRGWSNGAKYITGSDPFGGEVLEQGVICVDDETVSASDNARTKMEAMVKQLVANPIQRVHFKFQMPVLTEWLGMLLISCNLDMVSMRVLPGLNDGMKEKVNFYRIAERENRPNLIFPPQDEIAKLIAAELPYLARFLVDFVTPPEFIGDSRFGVKAHHDQTLKEASYQSTKSAQLYELLLISLNDHFILNPSIDAFRGTTTLVHRLIISNPYSQEILRTMRVEQVGRYLEQVQREGQLSCYTETVAGGLRSWVFPRFPALNLSPTPNEQSFPNRQANPRLPK